MDSTKRTSAKVRHIPRRSGVGMRQAITPRPAKVKRPRPAASALPPVCGVEHPDVEGLVCMSALVDANGKPFRHVGAHRATVLSGIRLRWTDEAAS